MRNALPLLTRTSPNNNQSQHQTNPSTNQNSIPSIRLISATPSAAGMSSDGNSTIGNIHNSSFDPTNSSSWSTIIPPPLTTSPLAPKQSATTKKRLVPKKSKLGLLNVVRTDKHQDKDRSKDLSDVVRRVSGGSLSHSHSLSLSQRGGFEIYVDPTDDPDIGEILMVKKKKSRAALDGMTWGGALGDVTNVPSVTVKEKEHNGLLKVKLEEKEKWWSIGRGRKDSKDKQKEKEKTKVRAKSPLPQEVPRSKTPEPLKFVPDTETRARFNSLDSRILLNTNRTDIRPENTMDQLPSLTYSRAGTPTAGGLLAPPPLSASASMGAGVQNNQGSIAIRAMRSVRSLARIGSWAQLKNAGVDEKEGIIKERTRDEEEKGTVKKKKKEKKSMSKKSMKEKETELKAQTVRLSTSSFEVGLPSPQPVKDLGKKRSILGLGLGRPSTMRLPNVRNGSTASSVVMNQAQIDANRLSVESAILGTGRNRAGSTFSSGSSLRPLSTTSSISRVSSSNSNHSNGAASVRWDEERLVSAKEMRRRDKEKERKTSESKHSEEGRKRTPITQVFPEVQRYPIVLVEEATNDGHCDDVVTTTPPKKARRRPVSEQLLGKSRPAPIENENGVMSILDAATNDLALLINNLDLEATPITPDLSPLKRSASKTNSLMDSPLGKTLRGSMASISSLRPYNQSKQDLIAQPIKPWSTLMQGLSPLKEDSSSTSASTPTVPTPPSASTFKPTHKRTMTPGPDPEPAPVFQPLKPPTTALKSRTAKQSAPALLPPAPITSSSGDGTIRGLSSLTFGSRPSSRNGSNGSIGSVFKRSYGHSRKRSSLSASAIVNDAQEQAEMSDSTTRSVPIPPEARRVLGMGGTMGGSDVDVSIYADNGSGTRDSLSDPDSDIPDELQFILSSANSDGESLVDASVAEDADTLSFEYRDGMNLIPYSVSPDSPLPSLPVYANDNNDAPPKIDLPIFRASLTDEHDNRADIDINLDFDEGGVSSEEDGEGVDTKKSFDFTGELRKLNESGASDRRSFVEQLENAFRTPAKVDLRYDFGVEGGLLRGVVQVPPVPVPRLPVDLSVAMEADDSSCSSASSQKSKTSTGAGFEAFTTSRIIDIKEPTFTDDEEEKSKFDMFPQNSLTSRIIDVKEPTLLQGSNSLGTSSASSSLEQSQDQSLTSSSGLRPSDGQLNTSFKFGGLPSPASTKEPKQETKAKPITLSDIIPPPSHVRSLSGSSSVIEDDSVLNSIFAKVSIKDFASMPAPPLPASTFLGVAPSRQRVDSDSSSKRRMRSDYFNASSDNALPTNANVNATGQNRGSVHYRTHSRHSSGISFAGIGIESFEEVRRGFEFNNERPAFYPPPPSAFNASASGRPYSRTNHRKHESVYSIASVSSYGRVINSGVHDPFDYDLLPSLTERPSREDMEFGESPSVDVDMDMMRASMRMQLGRGGVVEEDGDAMSFGMSTTVDDTFSFLGHGNNPYQSRFGRRTRVDSDASSFYFNAPNSSAQPSAQQVFIRGHKRDDSSLSISSFAPLPSGRPPSFLNRSLHQQHRRNDSNTSASSVAMSYANGGGLGWRRQPHHRRQEASIDSVMSTNNEFDALRLGRPGIGDKMFGGRDNENDNTNSISLPLSNEGIIDHNRFSFDSILDGDPGFAYPKYPESDDEIYYERRSSSYSTSSDAMNHMMTGVEDSLFDKTGIRNSSSSSDSVFGDEISFSKRKRFGGSGFLLPPGQFRPLSMVSAQSVHSPMKEDDTMISMLGGGHVRRRSIDSIIDASPCVRVDKKRKHSVFHALSSISASPFDLDEYYLPQEYDSPNKARIVEKPSIASTSSYQFGGERMIKAQKGLLERQSLEDSCLIADGEDVSMTFRPVPVFTRPGPATRSRSSTCTSSSGGDTPPLSASDGSSISEGSQSSIDLSHINNILSNVTHPMSTFTATRNRARARARGHGHRRRFSQARASRSSVYETIEEEMSNTPSPAKSSLTSSVNSKKSGGGGGSPTVQFPQYQRQKQEQQQDEHPAVYVVDSDTASITSESIWDDERGILALRKYYALRNEAETTVEDSKQQWVDTAFSLFAVQSFQPPRHPAGMRALLEHSVQNYGPLPSELRPRRVRSRTQSRPSPYPQARVHKPSTSQLASQQAVNRTSQNDLNLTFVASPPTAVTPAAPTATAAAPSISSVLKQVSINSNIDSGYRGNATEAPPKLDNLKVFSPLLFNDNSNDKSKPLDLGGVEPKRENAYGLAPHVRTRVGSTARRTALGWSKRSGSTNSSAYGGAKQSSELKENVGLGGMMTPGETLRINRPRPRGRPTPASQHKPIRV